MAFYLNMLREEDDMLSGNTGFDSDMVATPDDKYAVELKDVAQAVEDINADYADQSSDPELDAQDIQEDPVAECMIAIYESEHNWNMIMQTIGSRELLEAARGREMVMEAVDVKGFFEKVKAFFVKLFKKVTAIVKQWIGNLSATLRTNKSFLTKYGSKLADGKAAYEKDTSKKQFKGYNFPGVDGTMKKLLSVIEKANAITESSAQELIKKANSGDLSGISEKGDNRVNEYRGQMCGGSGSVSAGEFRDALKVAYFGSKEKETLTGKSIEVEHLKTILGRTNKDISDVKKLYVSVKKSFDKVIKALNELEKAVSKSQKAGEYDETRSGAMAAITKWTSQEKEMKNATSLAMTTMLKALRAERAQARKIANAYIYALNKKGRKDAWDKADGKKVATESGFFGALELI